MEDMPVMAKAQALHINNLASKIHVELLVLNRGESCTNVCQCEECFVKLEMLV